METINAGNKRTSLNKEMSIVSMNGQPDVDTSGILTLKETSGSVTLKEATLLAGFGRFQIILLICLLCFHMTDGMEILLMQLLPAQFKCKWPDYDLNKKASTTMALFLGMAIAAPFWGKLADSFGRRPMLISSTVLIAYFGFLSSLSPSSNWFIVLRFFVGMAIPGSYLAFVILSEFLPIQYKEYVLLIYSISWPLGGLFELLLGYLILPSKSLGWRYLVGFTSIPLWLCLILVKFIPESPQYSLVSGKTAEAETTVKRMFTMNKKIVPVDFKIVKEPKLKTGNFMDLFKNFHQARVTLQIWFLGFAIAFIYYGVLKLLTEIVERKYNACNIKVISNEEQDCQSCKELTSKDFTKLIIANCGELGGFVLNILLLKAFGRNKLMVLHFCGYGIFIFLLFICASSDFVQFFHFMIRVFSGANTVAHIFVTEISSQEIRALAFGCYQTWFRIGAMTTPLVAEVLTQRVNFEAAFMIYGVLAFSVAISIMFLPERKQGFLWPKLKDMLQSQKIKQ